ncbi:MAG: L-threonylcarbamoyladenylate synthase [Planctomycetota bacterium]
MKTQRITSVDEAAAILRRGGLVAFPTETVFGLGVDATNDSAVQRLFAAKGRPSDNPLIAHVGEPASWNRAASRLTPAARALLGAFAPGPLTVVLPKYGDVSSLVTAGLETVGVRVPSHPVAAAILRAAGLPIAAPSANRSGRPSCTTWRSVLEDLDGRIDAVFCEDGERVGIESTVVDCTGDAPIVLRPGAVTIEQIRRVVPNARDSDQATGAQCEVRSPGLLHPHYQPKAEVVLVDSADSIEAIDGSAAYCGIGGGRVEGAAFIALYATVDEYAAGFYELLREVDRRSLRTVYVQRAPPVGIGVALLDRQRRAAAK